MSALFSLCVTRTCAAASEASVLATCARALFSAASFAFSNAFFSRTRLCASISSWRRSSCWTIEASVAEPLAAAAWAAASAAACDAALALVSASSLRIRAWAWSSAVWSACLAPSASASSSSISLGVVANWRAARSAEAASSRASSSSFCSARLCSMASLASPRAALASRSNSDTEPSSVSWSSSKAAICWTMASSDDAYLFFSASSSFSSDMASRSCCDNRWASALDSTSSSSYARSTCDACSPRWVSCATSVLRSATRVSSSDSSPPSACSARPNWPWSSATSVRSACRFCVASSARPDAASSSASSVASRVVVGSSSSSRAACEAAIRSSEMDSWDFSASSVATRECASSSPEWARVRREDSSESPVLMALTRSGPCWDSRRSRSRSPEMDEVISGVDVADAVAAAMATAVAAGPTKCDGSIPATWRLVSSPSSPWANASSILLDAEESEASWDRSAATSSLAAASARAFRFSVATRSACASASESRAASWASSRWRMIPWTCASSADSERAFWINDVRQTEVSPSLREEIWSEYEAMSRSFRNLLSVSCASAAASPAWVLSVASATVASWCAFET